MTGSLIKLIQYTLFASDSLVCFYQVKKCNLNLGDVDKDKKPLALKLDSGDLLVMSGYSRKCYHGVPRILEGSFNHEKFKPIVI